MTCCSLVLLVAKEWNCF